MRTLEQWTDELPGQLRAAAREPARRLKRLAARLREELQRTAPGRLGDSVVVEVEDDQVQVYSTAPQAGILETGGTIRGRPWLAIPLGAAVGLPGPRSDPMNLFVLRARSGELFLASKASGAVEIRWKLQHEVHIPAQHWFSRGVDAATEGAEEELLDSVAGLIAGAP